MLPIRFALVCMLLLSVSNGHSSQTFQPTEQYFNVERVVDEVAYPWAMVFLADNQFLLTQRTGQLRLVSDFELGQPITGLPDDIYVESQGGLLDIAKHPQFDDNGWIYLSYSAGTAERNTLKVLRARLADNQLVDKQEILTVLPYRNTPVHYGAKMAFLADNTLLVTTGDGFDFREDAQRLNNQMGKILRVNDDGSIPSSNPFVEHTQNGLSDKVFSYGHRNPQGLVYDPQRRLVFSHEHGPDGGDELNIIGFGLNYGWPVITLGKDYSGASISPFTQYKGMQQPLVDWTPSIAPSGLSIYRGSLFEQMDGDLLVSTLKSKEILWLHMDDDVVLSQTSLFADLNMRFRNVVVHNDGSLYLLIDSSQGGILRVTPKALSDK